MEDYKEMERLYKAICNADLGEFCLHHIYDRCYDLKAVGVVWIPVNIVKEFVAFAVHALKRNVAATSELAPCGYYKAGMVQRIVLG